MEKQIINLFDKDALTLTLGRCCAVKALSLKQCLAFLDIEAARSDIADEILVRLVSYIVKEDIAEQQVVVTFREPANWFEHLKLEHAPQWILNHWPVKYKYHEKKALFKLEAWLIEKTHEYLEKTRKFRGKCVLKILGEPVLDEGPE